MGRSSLEEVRFDVTQFQEDEEETEGGVVIGEEGQRRGLIRLTVGSKQVPVIAVDTTNTELGLTRNGLLCAFRGTIVRAEGGRCSYTRHGPFMFHVTPNNRQVLYDGLRQAYLGSQKRETAPPVEKMVDRIRTVLERWLQHQAILSSEGALLLWDGSLAAPAASRSTLVVSQMLHEARERECKVLALSKKTTLGLRQGAIRDLIDDECAPSLLDIDEEARQVYGLRLRFLGHVYAAKLARSSFTFRVDIDRGLPEEEAVEGVRELLISDGLRENYPETLRLAHVLSRFSPTEAIGMQRFIRESYGLRFSSGPDVREVIFGPFGGSYSAHQGVSGP